MTPHDAGTTTWADGYAERRDWVGRHFQASAERWARITSDAPVGRIRATVRAGREEMRNHFLAHLPEDLGGWRVLDAGCGPGDLSIALCRRGAEVVGVDLSPDLVDQARSRATSACATTVEFRAGDMLDPGLGRFDAVVAMDSLIHYPLPQVVGALGRWAERTSERLLFTVAPANTLLRVMHALGSLFPRSHRSPSIHPISDGRLRRALAADPALPNWTESASERVVSGFYVSRLVELRREGSST